MNFIVVVAAAALGVSAAAQAAPRTILLNGDVLQHLRSHPDAVLLLHVRGAADKALHQRLETVMNCNTTPPSGDKHDYMSLAPYFWPNPDTPNHLPYVRRDGEHNPETELEKDHQYLDHMVDNVHALALGYYFTGNEVYAQRAAAQLQMWFLDPATRMNPNLKYAQAVRGKNDGRGTGILDVRSLVYVVDSLAMLAGSPSWTPAQDAAMHSWFEAYFTWLTTSENGRAESSARNNHGSWYDVQAEGIALYLGKTEFARSLAEEAKTKRIAVQIQPDGQQPLEEARTKSFSYSVFNLDALTTLATEAQTVGVDLWSYKSPQGGSIRTALDYLLPYAEHDKKWTHEAINGISPDSLRDPLLRTAVHDRDAAYETDGRAMGGDDTQTLLFEQEFDQGKKAGR